MLPTVPLESLFWLTLLLGVVTAPVGRPFRTATAGWGDVVRRHSLDPAAAQRVRRAVFLGQQVAGERERSAAAECARVHLDRRVRQPREQRARWRAYLALEVVQVGLALAGLVRALVTRGGHAAVLAVVFALLAVGPLVGPVVRRRRDDRIRRAAGLNAS